MREWTRDCTKSKNTKVLRGPFASNKPSSYPLMNDFKLDNKIRRLDVSCPKFECSYHLYTRIFSFCIWRKIILFNLVASMVFNPAADSLLMNSILVAVGTICFSFCRPSRGPTSTILTVDPLTVGVFF